MRPWLVIKCKEYLGQEEKVFIDAIIKRLLNKEPPQNIVNKVLNKVLEEDSEVFVTIIYRLGICYQDVEVHRVRTHEIRKRIICVILGLLLLLLIYIMGNQIQIM